MRKRTKLVFGAIAVLIILAVVIAILDSTSKNNIDGGNFGTPLGRPMLQKNSIQSTGIATDQAPAPGMMQEVSNTAVSDSNGKEQNRMIIRSGSLSVVTKDVRKSVEEVSAYVASAGGFVVSSSIEGTADAPSATIEVRVPVDNFQQAIDNIKKAGIRVTSESTSGEDVTEDYTDTQANIKNLQASEAQFQEIMKQATKVSDVLEVQKQLERVRGEIDVVQGHAQYLEKSAKLSRIIVYFAIDEGQLPVVSPINEWSPLTILKSAFRAFVILIQGIGTLVIWLIAFIPIWIIIAVGVIIFVRKRAKKSIVIRSAPVSKKTK